jgi:hypothetical protein
MWMSFLLISKQRIQSLVDKFRQLWKTLGVGVVLDAPVSFDCFAFTPPAHLPRDVPEKAEAFSYQGSMRDTTSY